MVKQTLKVLGIPGSLRDESYNKDALRAAKDLAPDFMDITIATLDGIPPFDQDNETNPPEAVVRLKRQIRESDALLFATPEYNYSVPGVLKNAIDWVSRPYGDNAWEGKPAAIMGASISMTGTVRAQFSLRKIFVFLNIKALNKPEVMIPNAAEKFAADGMLTDQHTKDKIRELLLALADWTITLKEGEQEVSTVEKHIAQNSGAKGGKVQNEKNSS